MTNANDQSRLDQTGSMVAPEPGGASGQVGGDAARAGATAPAPLAGSPRTPDMPDDIRQHVCVTAAQAAPSAGTTRAERLALKELAISGKPFGPGSHTEHEGKTMTGAQAIIASLEAEGVDTLFGYPGGQAIKIYDALYDSTKIRHILARHEQGAVHEADGYARATGKVGVVLVTSGPGATNTVTGIATAYMDSVPLVVITGQVTRGVIGTDAFQEADIVGITMPVVKHSFLLQSTDDLTKTFREAFYIASTGRPGPVLIDIPSDLAARRWCSAIRTISTSLATDPTIVAMPSRSSRRSSISARQRDRCSWWVAAWCRAMHATRWLSSRRRCRFPWSRPCWARRPCPAPTRST